MNSAKKNTSPQVMNKSPTFSEVNKKETLNLIQRINEIIQKNPQNAQKAALILADWLNSKKK